MLSQAASGGEEGAGGGGDCLTDPDVVLAGVMELGDGVGVVRVILGWVRGRRQEASGESYHGWNLLLYIDGGKGEFWNHFFGDSFEDSYDMGVRERKLGGDFPLGETLEGEGESDSLAAGEVCLLEREAEERMQAKVGDSLVEGAHGSILLAASMGEGGVTEFVGEGVKLAGVREKAVRAEEFEAACPGGEDDAGESRGREVEAAY